MGQSPGMSPRSLPRRVSLLRATQYFQSHTELATQLELDYTCQLTRWTEACHECRPSIPEPVLHAELPSEVSRDTHGPEAKYNYLAETQKQTHGWNGDTVQGKDGA